MRKIVSYFLFFSFFLALDVLIIQYLINNQSNTSSPEISLTKSSLIKTQIPSKQQLSFDSIFSYQDPASNQSRQPDEITLLATGDVIPARSVNYQMVKLNDFRYPFAKTADFLKNSDITFINLETPLIPNCQPTVEGMVFCGDEKAVEGLVSAGVKVANIANNHMSDYGIEGINNTTKLLQQNNIAVCGNGSPAILDIKGKKFGFLGYNDISERYDLLPSPKIDILQKDIRDLKIKADYVIVAFHWGVEYTSSPSARQKELAHSAIDAGADLIIGNHPHWVGAVEQYKDKFTTYAHGNFIFDQMWSQETREGVIGKYIFGDTGLKSVNFYSVIIENYSQPRFATQTEAEKILLRIKTNSFKE